MKPSELSRLRLEKRAQEQIALSNNITPKRLLKSPSQKKSERAKAKELKRAGVVAGSKAASEVEPPCDCNGCPMEPCGKTLKECDAVAIVARCSKCGERVLRRSNPEQGAYLCVVCRS